MKTPVIWLVRVSTDQQDTARQFLSRDDTISRGPYTLTATVTLKGVSETAVDKSSEWQDLTAALLSTPGAVLGVDDLSRLCRPAQFDFGPVQWLVQRGFKILTPGGLIESNSSHAFWQLLIGVGQGGAELRDMQRRIAAGRDAKLKTGVWSRPDHTLPRGVLWDGCGKRARNGSGKRLRGMCRSHLRLPSMVAKVPGIQHSH